MSQAISDLLAFDQWRATAVASTDTLHTGHDVNGGAIVTLPAPNDTAQNKFRYIVDRFQKCVAMSQIGNAVEYLLAAIDLNPLCSERQAPSYFVECFCQLYVPQEHVYASANEEWSWADRLDDFLSSANTIQAQPVALGLVRVSFHFPELLELLNLSREARINLRHVFGNSTLGLHEQVARLAEEYRRSRDDFSRNVSAVLSTADFSDALARRQALINSLRKLEQHYSAGTLMAVHDILTSKLTNFDKQRSRATLESLCSAVQGLVDTVLTQDSMQLWFSVQLVSHLADLAQREFDRLSSTSQARITASLGKNIYPVNGDKVTLEVLVSNRGRADASDLTIVMASSDPSARVVPDTISVKSVPANSDGIQLVSFYPPTPPAIIRLDCALSWTDEYGNVHDMDHEWRLLPQRKVDWDGVFQCYSPSAVKRRERLFGRDDKLRRLRMGLATGVSYVITGQKRVGKTSVAQVYHQELQAMHNILSVYISWGQFAGLTLTELGFQLTSRWAQECKERFGSAPSVPSRDDLDRAFSPSLVAFATSVLMMVPDLRCVLMFDDMDELPLELYTGSSGQTLFMALRTIIAEERLSIILIGSERLPFILRDQAQRLNQLRTVTLDYIDDIGAYTELVTKPATGVLEYLPEAIERLMYWSAGNPYYTISICMRILEYAVENKDYCVSGRDVDNVIEKISDTEVPGAFEHLWTEGIHAAGEELRRISRQNAELLIAIAQASEIGATSSSLVTGVREVDPSEAPGRLDNLADRGVLTNNRDHWFVKIPLFRAWIRSVGANRIRSTFGVRDQRMVLEMTVRDEELTEILSNLTYRGGNVSLQQVRAWLEQFGDSRNQRLAFYLLRAAKRWYFGPERLENSYVSIKRRILQGTGFTQHFGKGNLLDNLFVVPGSGIGHSGASMVYRFRLKNRIDRNSCGSIDAIAGLVGRTESAILVLDDSIGTSESAVKTLRSFRDILRTKAQKGWEVRTKLFYSVVVGYEETSWHIEQQFGQEWAVVLDSVVTESDMPFSPNGSVFQSEAERRAAFELCYSIGKSLYPSNPLGYGDCQGLVVFEHNCPNNTLPIFWKNGVYDGKPWVPLFPRG